MPEAQRHRHLRVAPMRLPGRYRVDDGLHEHQHLEIRPARAAVSEYAAVPCGSCRLCCQNHTLVMLTDAENPADYETVTRKGALCLAMKENGDCIYLGEQGCTIHD